MNMSPHARANVPSRFSVVSALLVAVACLPVLCLAQSTPPPSNSRNFALAHVPSLKRLYVFGGEDDQGPRPNVFYVDLASPFKLDSVPFSRDLTPLSKNVSQLIPLVYKGTKAGNFVIELAAGWTRDASGSTFTPNRNAWRYEVPDHTTAMLPDQLNVNFRWCARSAAMVPVQEWFGPNAAQLPSDPAAYCFGGNLPGTDGQPATDTLRVLRVKGELQAQPPSGVPPRESGALGRLNQTHLMVSGGIAKGQRQDDAWLYNIPSALWSLYPHRMLKPRELHRIVGFMSAKGTRYAITIGDADPLVEYFDLSRTAPATAGTIINASAGPRSIDSTSLVVVGNQILLVGGKLGGDQTDKRHLYILNVIAEDSGLKFEWSDTFTPPTDAELAVAFGFGTISTGTATVTPTATSAPSTTPLIDGAASGAPIGIIAAAAVGGAAVVLCGAALVILKRKKAATASSTNAGAAGPIATTTSMDAGEYTFKATYPQQSMQTAAYAAPVAAVPRDDVLFLPGSTADPTTPAGATVVQVSQVNRHAAPMTKYRA
ncbi:hypothetical protein H9P43_008081 [Blastocladiella emersonii ATCC 22665]|nr:hypothetical protein H9P43_008081 [Blastocladiella emersonii ATCC 22665]